MLLQTFADFESDAAPDLEVSPRTFNRIQSGQSRVKQATYLKLKRDFVARVAIAFPRCSESGDFVDSYVDEYFRLWGISAEGAHRWVAIPGSKRAAQAALSGALLRDLVLRFAYLASIERRLNGDVTIPLMPVDTIERCYAICIGRTSSGTRTIERVAEDLGVDEKTIRDWKSGRRPPPGWAIKEFAKDGDQSLIGIGFLDHLLRRLNLRNSALANEALRACGEFMFHHQDELTALERGRFSLRKATTMPGALLLHPGVEATIRAMPDSLWRAHTYCLRFARPFDLTRAYLRFATGGNVRHLVDFLDRAEVNSDGDPSAWMQRLEE